MRAEIGLMRAETSQILIRSDIGQMRAENSQMRSETRQTIIRSEIGQMRSETRQTDQIINIWIILKFKNTSQAS